MGLKDWLALLSPLVVGVILVVFKFRLDRSLAKTTSSIQQALEQMRAELASDVEIRKQVAQRFVGALFEVMEKVDALLAATLSMLAPPDEISRASVDLIERLDALKHLFPEATYDQLQDLVSEFTTAAYRFRESAPEALERTLSLHKKLTNLIRQGLLVGPRAEGGSAS